MQDTPTSAPVASCLVERWLDGISQVIMPLALAIGVLLFLQWPLRDGVGAGSSQANDLAQWLFALYVAVALRHADRHNAHLICRPDLAGAGHGWRRAIRQLGAPLAVLPWALYAVWHGAPMVLRPLLGLARFPDTDNAGYFKVKVALQVLAGLMALQSLADLWRTVRTLRAQPEAA